MLKYNFLVQGEPKHGRHVKFSFMLQFVGYSQWTVGAKNMKFCMKSACE